MGLSVNKVELIGNLGRDPEMRTTQAGKTIATLSIATSESWKDQRSGEWVERTEWHRVVIFICYLEFLGIRSAISATATGRAHFE
jgi:single-strand DNA-binding protein